MTPGQVKKAKRMFAAQHTPGAIAFFMDVAEFDVREALKRKTFEAEITPETSDRRTCEDCGADLQPRGDNRTCKSCALLNKRSATASMSAAERRIYKRDSKKLRQTHTVEERVSLAQREAARQ